MSHNMQNGFNGPQMSTNSLINGSNGQNIHMQPSLAISLFSNIQNGINPNQRNFQQPQLNWNPLQFLQQQSLQENNLLQMQQNLAHQFVQANNSSNSFLQLPPNPHSFSSSIFKEQIPSKASNDSGIFEATATSSLIELQNIAMKGLKSASMIHNDNFKRPYFKKIDLLCDRLSQDLSVTGKALVNINSHGVAWAVKDFIFVFNRIIGAWCIIRDYFYTQEEGMQCVKEEMDPELEKNYLAWQDATAKFSRSLITSFENLNVRNLRNGNRKPCSTGKTKGTENFQKIFDPLVIEAEDAQLSGTYLKSAIYKPVSTVSSMTSHQNQDPFKCMFGDLFKEYQSEQPKTLYERASAEKDHF